MILIKFCAVRQESIYFCGTSPGETRSAIQEVLDDEELCDRIGRNAREFIVEHFEPVRVVEMELTMLGELAG